MERFPVGDGAIAEAAAFVSRETVIAVTHDFDILGSTADVFRMVKTSDGGHTWRSLTNTPVDTVGVRFADERNGWTWTDHRLYSTGDGGDTWAEVSLPLAALPRADALPLVVDGKLWVPLGHTAGSPPGENMLILVRPDRGMEIVRKSDSFHFRALASYRDRIWGIVQEAGADEASRLVRIDTKRPYDFASLSALPAGTPFYLGVHPDGIVAGLVSPAEARPFISRSVDGGKTWISSAPLRASAYAFCSASAQLIWVFDTTGGLQVIEPS